MIGSVDTPTLEQGCKSAVTHNSRREGHAGRASALDSEKSGAIRYRASIACKYRVPENPSLVCRIQVHTIEPQEDRSTGDGLMCGKHEER